MKKKQDVFAEMLLFQSKISELSISIIDQIKPFVIANHSVRKELRKSPIGKTSVIDVHQDVQVITFSVELRIEDHTDLITNDKIYSFYYRLHTYIDTNKSSILDGKVDLWVQRILQSKLNLIDFPNWKLWQATN